MTDQKVVEAAAKAAGEWWASQLLGSFAEKRDEFAAVVASLVAQELRGECYWDWWGQRKEGEGYSNESRSEFDYDPHNLLCPAFAQVWPEARSWHLKQAMPQKHSLDVTSTELIPRRAMGIGSSLSRLRHEARLTKADNPPTSRRSAAATTQRQPRAGVFIAANTKPSSLAIDSATLSQIAHTKGTHYEPPDQG